METDSLIGSPTVRNRSFPHTQCRFKHNFRLLVRISWNPLRSTTCVAAHDHSKEDTHKKRGVPSLLLGQNSEKILQVEWRSWVQAERKKNWCLTEQTISVWMILSHLSHWFLEGCLLRSSPPVHSSFSDCSKLVTMGQFMTHSQLFSYPLLGSQLWWDSPFETSLHDSLSVGSVLLRIRSLNSSCIGSRVHGLYEKFLEVSSFSRRFILIVDDSFHWRSFTHLWRDFVRQSQELWFVAISLVGVSGVPTAAK